MLERMTLGLGSYILPGEDIFLDRSQREFCHVDSEYPEETFDPNCKFGRQNLKQMYVLVWEICMYSQAWMRTFYVPHFGWVWMLAPLGPIILRKCIPCQQIPYLFFLWLHLLHLSLLSCFHIASDQTQSVTLYIRDIVRILTSRQPIQSWKASVVLRVLL